MNKDVTYVTQTRYYSPVFNAAIFDGPIRLYFSQQNEADALKIYFDLQERMETWDDEWRESFRRLGQCLFVMLYPSEETFILSFEDEPKNLAIRELGRDHLIGIRCALIGGQNVELIDMIEAIFRKTTALQSESSGPHGSILSKDLQ